MEMKKRAFLLISIILIALLVSGIALAQSPVTGNNSSGGGYHLTLLTWQVSGESSGDGYTLYSPEAPSLESGCCCIYLPCVQRAP